MNNSTYTLGIIELFYPPRHLDLLNVHIHPDNGYYVCPVTISLKNFYNIKLVNFIKNSFILLYNDQFIEYNCDYHYFHPNFKNIIQSEDYFNIKILKIININSNKNIIIDKTFFLKIFQRKFKKYFYKKYLHFPNYTFSSLLETDSDESSIEADFSRVSSLLETVSEESSTDTDFS